DASGRRPVYGGSETFQTDPNWRDHILFYEYFHGDNGAGIGASHQTGWTGGVARMSQGNGALAGEMVQPPDLQKKVLTIGKRCPPPELSARARRGARPGTPPWASPPVARDGAAGTRSAGT